ncbi:hypothetical protein HQ489_02050 [Candidatus Woesearchaeota archaeon]|nr:hypothetical protein [Candidatus Woesearchaeota archaeon]
MELEQHFSDQLKHSLHTNGVNTLYSTDQYLRKMLVKFVDSDQLFPQNQDPLLIEFMESGNNTHKLHDIGDRCLFLTGYFYDSLRKMGKGFVDYHYDIGRSAFGNLAGISRTLQSREMYNELSGLFFPLSVAIGDLRLPSLGEKEALDIYSKWVITKDDRYKHTLSRLGIQVDAGNKN